MAWKRDVYTDHDACGVGFIAQAGSTGSREVVERALVALGRLSHRGGVDADGTSGDGAGLLTAIPQDFIRERARKEGIELPREFGLGMVFLPRGRTEQACAAIEDSAEKAGLRFLGWRDVPVNAASLGPRAEATVPVIRQCFVAAGGGWAERFLPVRPGSPIAEGWDDDTATSFNSSGLAALTPEHDWNVRASFERRLFLWRKRTESEAPAGTYFCSLSSRTMVYKGLLTPAQLAGFYPDLASEDFVSPFAVFHQRYSTNTQPSWKLAQPFRLVGHNGEINTLSANRRWMRARGAALREEFGAGEWFQALEEGVSDSASFDNALEIHLRRGFNLAEAMLRMVPAAWENNRQLDARVRDYLEGAAREQEPWDGPAALVFSDGRFVGAKLDRNGLRPLRYTLTADGLIVLGSEVGIADLHAERVIERQRLGPGEMLLVDLVEGTVYRNGEISKLLAKAGARSVSGRAVRLKPTAGTVTGAGRTAEPKRTAAALGWTEDQFRLLFEPLGAEGKEATWSMGDDGPPAFLSAARRPLWDYCKQRFAQVTNPPIDPLREQHVMSLEVHLGAGVVMDSPVVDAWQMVELEGGLLQPAARIDITFAAEGEVEAALEALARVEREAAAVTRGKPAMVVLSDRGVSAERAALPALLATAAVWKGMVWAEGGEIPLVVESGQVIETHHVAVLVAAGASAVYPYLALELAEGVKAGGAGRYRAAVEAGLRKVIARMGISTVASYRNSQLFEIVGLDPDVCEKYFEDAAAVLGGKSLRGLLQDSLARHARAFAIDSPEMEDAGYYRYRQAGERHGNSPELVRRLHAYIKAPTAEAYRAYAELAETREPVALRDLLEAAPGEVVALEEVESEEAILARLCTQAMSLGALGPEAHRTIAIAMNRLGARSNTGEGGEDAQLYRREPEAANRVKQVASARFGVTAEYLVRADELEIKMAQGSKPGEGGQLPATKVTPYIARLRHAVPGMSLISPPPHHDIYSIEDLAQLIYDLRAINPWARIGVKLVSGAGVGIIAAGVAKAGADVITISGFDGGTGASPLTSIKNTGLPWEVGLREAHVALLRTGFRKRVRLRVDGGFKSGRDVILAALLGADEFGFGTAALLAIGCVMARQCHLNTCPAGVATQDEKLRMRFTGKPEMVMDYFHGVAGEVRERLAALGARSLAEITGEAGRLRLRNAGAAGALAGLLAAAPDAPEGSPGRAEESSGIHQKVARLAKEYRTGPLRRHRLRITNSDRSVGAHLSGRILRFEQAKRRSGETLECEFTGSAGQSFGAFLISGLRFRLHGEANDYVGKGLSGGTIAVTAGREASLRGDVLAGNTVLYGATGGELYIAGRAGERFAVRNSGALAVVEGVGQHGCEYMTAGVVIILGPAGNNLGSGMTGGLAYVLRSGLGEGSHNGEFVRAEMPGAEEEEWLRRALEEHARWTGSPGAAELLRSAARLPLIRLAPLQLPCTIAQTWAGVLERFEKRDPQRVAIEVPVPRDRPVAGEPLPC